MRILHIVPGAEDECNGIAVAAKLLADGQRKGGHDVGLVDATTFSASVSDLVRVDEVYVHSMWLPTVWKACLAVLKAKKVNLESTLGDFSMNRPLLVRMTHANLDPIRYRYHGWKKRLVAPIERWLFSKADRVITTGDWETTWCRQWGVKTEIVAVDLRQPFAVNPRCGIRSEERSGRSLHVLYLGRRHPLKGVRFLERAVAELNADSPHAELRAESAVFGEEKEKAWAWCDVFCLPTLSENFGLVVAEALEHGKPVIVTDGAPAWDPELHSTPAPSVSLIYLRGYREGDDTRRVKLLKEALTQFVDGK